MAYLKVKIGLHNALFTTENALGTMTAKIEFIVLELETYLR